MHSLSSSQNKIVKVTLGLITISGISFWFFLGFPFANHNESYIWVTQLSKTGLLDTLTKNIRPVANYRPLGTALAWLGYKTFGSIYPIELFNYFIAALSWIVLFLAIKEKKIFSFVALTIGGFFFTGYIYLFHLHGIFYSPLLFLIAILFYLNQSSLNNNQLIIIFLLSAIISLVHPFALLIYLAYIPVLLFEKKKNLTAIQFIINILFIIAIFFLIKVLSGNSSLPLANKNVIGLLTSYRMVEINITLSIVAFLLCMATIFSTNTYLLNKLVFIIFTALLSLFFYFINLPIIIIWILLCFLKMIFMKKWPIASLIIATFLFPIFTGTGSPTYTIFVLMTCAATVAINCPTFDNSLYFSNLKILALIPITILFVVCCLRYDINIPGLAKLTRPLLAEREKTFQLENIISWIMKSKFKQYYIGFNTNAVNPEGSNKAIDRRYRPPTYQFYLDEYLDSVRIFKNDKDNPHKLIICFGGGTIDKAQSVYFVKGKYTAKATVYLGQK